MIKIGKVLDKIDGIIFEVDLKKLFISYFKFFFYSIIVAVIIAIIYINGWSKALGSGSISQSEFWNLQNAIFVLGIFTDMSCNILLTILLKGHIFKYSKKAAFNNTNTSIINTQYASATLSKNDERTLKLRAYHESGHAVMANILNIPIESISLDNNSGYVKLNTPNISKASEIKKYIMIAYSGFMAEKLLNDEASDGCMGSDKSDMEFGNTLLRKYIILTDETLSLTGYEENYIKEKSIELSKVWLEEAKILLSDHKEDIENMANDLIDKTDNRNKSCLHPRQMNAKEEM